MAFQYKFFLIPIMAPEQTEEELNRFLRTVSVLNIHKEFVKDGGAPAWSFAVEYLKGGKSVADAGDREWKGQKSRKDYREVLDPEDFVMFAKLRDWRKARAQADAVPVYTLFTNEQLAAIAQQKAVSKQALSKIEGIGAARIKKYSEDVIRIISEFEAKSDEKNGESLPKNS